MRYFAKMILSLDNLLQRVAVAGASGKMGRGIALLLLEQMALDALKGEEAHLSQYHLSLIDIDESRFRELKLYLQKELVRFAEKNIQLLRDLFSSIPSIVSNREVIDAFLKRAFDMVDCSSAIEHLRGSRLVFEAAFEDVDLKVALLKSVHSLAPDAFVFTNTSSIPIGLLADRSALKGRLIGFHFYNPPPVQKLVELIAIEKSEPSLLEVARALGERLDKIVVPSADRAGFIGNGHLAREVVFACQLVEELEQKYASEVAIQIVDQVTKAFLLRPMGIFQLIDYIGWEVVGQVLAIMETYLPDPELSSPWFKKYLEKGLRGGQTMEGKPKNGIFSYVEGKVEGVFTPSGGYVPLEALTFLGELPIDLSWKKIQKEPALIKQIPTYFSMLFQQKSFGSELAKRFLSHSRKVEELLVETHVARSLEDVGSVLKNGFYHLYSPHEVLKDA